MGLSHWHGEELAARMVAASIEAIDEVTAEAVSEAKQDHWWENRTDRLEHETIAEPAHATPQGASGRFGTTQRRGYYGLFLEYRRPFLRPIADRVFPTLEQKLREKL